MSPEPSFVVEEFIPYSFEEALSILPRTTVLLACENVARMAARLDYRGINFDLKSQIRVNEVGDVFLVDFGADLCVGDLQPANKLRKETLEGLKTITALLGDAQRQAVAQTYDEFISAKNAFNPEYGILDAYNQQIWELQQSRNIEKYK